MNSDVATALPEELNSKMTLSEGESKDEDERPGIKLLKSWLNKNIKVEMTDGRFLLGVFLCTDRSSNVIVGNCTEYTCDPETVDQSEEPRVLGLSMVPGHHIVKLYIDQDNTSSRLRANSPTLDSD